MAFSTSLWQCHEVKCPYTAKYERITEQTVPFLKLVGNELVLKEDHGYHYQVQGQLECARRDLCHLVIFTFTGKKIVTVKKDVTFVKKKKAKLKSFYEQYLRDLYIEKVQHKSYYDFDFAKQNNS